jgi:thiamine biosynthesis protein ThiS
MISIQVNGDPRLVEPGWTILDLLGSVARDPRTVAVEHNGCILPRARYGETSLLEGDRLEIVHFVQGG